VSRKERDGQNYITKMGKKLSERGLVVRDKLVIGDAAQAIIYHAERSPCETSLSWRVTVALGSGDGRLAALPTKSSGPALFLF
jgi:hypothetical protein